MRYNIKKNLYDSDWIIAGTEGKMTMNIIQVIKSIQLLYLHFIGYIRLFVCFYYYLGKNNRFI